MTKRPGKAAPTRPRLKRRTLWLGFVIVLVPLVVMLALQYRWLVKLDHASQVAHEAALTNYLEAVNAKVRNFYTWNAERTLNLPAYLFTDANLGKAAPYFKKKEPEGARRLFVMSFVGDHDGEALYFDPTCSTFSSAEWSPEARAVYVTTSSWRTMAHKGGTLETVAPVVDERDPDNRIVLYPVTDEASRVVGVAGMVLDEDFFRHELLPKAVAGVLPKFFPGDRSRDPVVTVRDGRARLAFTTDPKFSGPAEVAKPLQYVFTDHRIGLSSRHQTAGEWARHNFQLNVGLSAVLAAVLLGGVVLALRTASREMRLSQMKSDFVSNVSHELRTPLASVRVFGELLRLGRVDDMAKVREYGEYIEAEGRRLTQLINNLLDFSRIESGRKSYRMEPADLEEVVRETLHSFEVRLRQSGFRLDYQGPEAALPRLRLDPSAIAHCVSNLLDNAIKYSGDGREIRVRLRRRGRWIVFSVRDWGIGVPRDEQEKIFDRFHRVSTGLVHDVKGSGLGLAIVRHMVEAHGGRVEVESRSGQGSTFSLLLPLERLAVQEEPVEGEREGARPPGGLPLLGGEEQPSEA